MKIALVSDVHLEFGDLDIQNDQNADLLVMAGDILVAESFKRGRDETSTSPHVQIAKSFRNFIQRASDRFPTVIAIAGNHEFYQGRWNQTLDILVEEYSRFPNVHFLEDRTVTIDGWKFIGCTMWTDVDKGNPVAVQTVQYSMNDYKQIINETRLGRLHVKDTVQRHQRSISFIKNEILNSSKNILVTHMAPCILSSPERYRMDPVSHAYYSDQTDLILDNPSIKLWMHGHMHNESDYSIGDCRILCNPRGYLNYERQPNEPYYPKVIEL